MPIAAAVPAIIGAGSSLIGGAMQSRAAGRAADAQTQASRQSNQLQWNTFQAQTRLNDPMRLGGGQAYNEYMQMLGLAPVNIQPASEILSQFGPDGMGLPRTGGTSRTPSGPGGRIFGRNQPPAMPQPVAPPTGAAPAAGVGYTPQQVDERLRATPGYQFRFNEGQNAVQTSAAARGGLNSGATLRALTRYGQDYGTGEFDNYLNRLSTLFGGAQQATNNIGNAAGNFANNAGNNINNAGNARANMYVNQSNAQTGALSSIANVGADWWGRSRAPASSGTDSRYFTPGGF